MEHYCIQLEATYFQKFVDQQKRRAKQSENIDQKPRKCGFKERIGMIVYKEQKTEG